MDRDKIQLVKWKSFRRVGGCARGMRAKVGDNNVKWEKSLE